MSLPLKRPIKTEDDDFDGEEYNTPLRRPSKSNKAANISMLRENATAVLRNSTLMPFRWLKNVYRCFYCYDMFEETKHLKEHQQMHKDEDSVAKMMKNYWEPVVFVDTLNTCCKLCSIELKNIDVLVDHLIEVHQIKYNKEVKTFLPFRLTLDTLNCLDCGQSFRTFGHLLMHTNRSHKGNSEALCDTCGQYFKNSTELTRHKETVHDKKAVLCNICGMNVVNINRIRSHMQRFHNKKYKCFYCSELFPSHYKRSRHSVEVHSIKEKVKCTECDMSFIYRSTMLRHIRESHLKERNEVCPLCGFLAFGKGRLSVHMRKHSDEREFTCGLCDKAFKCKKNLKQHMKNLHEKMSDVNKLQH